MNTSVFVIDFVKKSSNVYEINCSDALTANNKVFGRPWSALIVNCKTKNDTAAENIILRYVGVNCLRPVMRFAKNIFAQPIRIRDVEVARAAPKSPYEGINNKLSGIFIALPARNTKNVSFGRLTVSSKALHVKLKWYTKYPIARRRSAVAPETYSLPNKKPKNCFDSAVITASNAKFTINIHFVIVEYIVANMLLSCFA